jgi:hypothetical protein
MFVLRSGSHGDKHDAPAKRGGNTQMKSGIATLIGVGVLSLAVGVGNASAATRHQHRHAVKSHAVQAPVAGAQVGALTQSGNNPAKQYSTRKIADNAMKDATGPQAGNNPAKRYPTRKIADNAMKDATGPQAGNNPAKRYKNTTTGSASR